MERYKVVQIKWKTPQDRVDQLNEKIGVDHNVIDVQRLVPRREGSDTDFTEVENIYLEHNKSK